MTNQKRANQSRGVLANTARAVTSVIGKVVTKTSRVAKSAAGTVKAKAVKPRPKKAGSSKAGRSAAKRELINTGKDKRYVRRNKKGQFQASDDVRRSLGQDVKRKARRRVPAGQGDRGDRPR
jgi:hypothetical protein